ncbi:MAG: ParA family protein, partial [Pseudoxanthomonas sp.]
ATVGFLNSLSKVTRVHNRKLPVGLVVNRSKPWTNTSQQAVEMLKIWPYPVVAQLRDTQAYVVLAGLGRSLFDYRSAQVRDHQADWDPLLKWIKKA